MGDPQLSGISPVGPNGASTATGYDQARRPISVTDPGGNTTAFAYDSAGNQNAVVDPVGNTTHFGYDVTYNLYETSTTIGGGQVVRGDYSYDKASRLASTTAPGASGTSTYSYDSAGRLSSTTDPDGATYGYGYSVRGELAGAIAPDGVVSTYQYDPAGHMVGSSNSRDGNATYQYDPAGRPTAVQDDRGSGSIYKYDTAGRRTGEIAAYGSGGSGSVYGVTSTLSPGGRRTVTYQGNYSLGPSFSLSPGPQSETTYSYNDDGTLGIISSPQLVGGGIENTYEPVTGRLATQSRPGATTAYNYDPSGRVSEATTTAGSGEVIEASVTRYDPRGNVISQGASSYGYDELGRMTSAHDGELGHNYTYQYDLASNRTQVTKNGALTQSLSFTTADKIDTATHPEYAYDAAGRLVSDTTAAGEKRRYIWDGHGRLAGIDVYHANSGQSDNVRYGYDSTGRLAEKTNFIDLTWSTEHLFYHYDGDRLIGEEDMTGTVREYLYAGGEAPTAMRARQADGSYKNYFFATNTHGDVVAVTDRDGNIVNRYAYGPWGEATRVSEQIHQPFRYAGYRYEDGFDLYYLRARWYDSGTGRFLSRDSVPGSPLDLISLNRYLYASARPSTLTDPGGHSPKRPGGIYALANYVTALALQTVGPRPNNRANVDRFVELLKTHLVGPGPLPKDGAIAEFDSEGWKPEYVDEQYPSQHIMGAVVLSYWGASGPAFAWGVENANRLTCKAGATQEDYRASLAAQELGDALFFGTDEGRDLMGAHNISFLTIRANELGTALLLRFGKIGSHEMAWSEGQHGTPMSKPPWC